MHPIPALLRSVALALAIGLAASASMASPQPAATHGPTLAERVKARGAVRCGGFERPGLAERDGAGRWHGIEVDICRAVAFVVLGSQERIAFDAYLSHDDVERVRSGVDDIYFLSGREIAANRLAGFVLPGPAIYVASIGLMVPGDASEQHVSELAGKSICFHSGDSAESSLEQVFESLDVLWLRHPYSETGEMNDAYAVQRCHAVAGETTELAHTRLYAAQAKLGSRILPESLSDFPILAATGLQDARWTALVHWVIDTLVVAERPERKWVAGGARSMPVAAPELGLDAGWQDRLVKAIGHYGAVYERNLGLRSPYRLERGANAGRLQGGLLLAPFVE